jgi:hypothetical protein
LSVAEKIIRNSIGFTLFNTLVILTPEKAIAAISIKPQAAKDNTLSETNTAVM